MHILCDAVPFGFGPVSKLISLAYVLADEYSCTLTFAGTGCSLDLARTCEAFAHHIEVDTANPSACDSVLGHRITEYDGVLSVMNPEFLEWVQEHQLRTVVVDSLLPMWDEIPVPWHKATGVIIQNNHGAVERAANELSTDRTLVVGPLLDPFLLNEGLRNAGRSGERTILVNLGGADDPISTIPSLCGNVIQSLLVDLPALQEFDNKLLTVGKRQHAALRGLERQGFVVRTCGHRDFLSSLATCDVFLTTPGLTGSFEAFCLGTKTCFLPPFNYSQYLNLQTFRQFGAAPLSLHWSDLGVCTELLQPRLPEERAVNLLETSISHAVSETQAISILRELLTRHVSLAAHEPKHSYLFHFQRHFFSQNGCIGTPMAADFIIETLTCPTGGGRGASLVE